MCLLFQMKSKEGVRSAALIVRSLIVARLPLRKDQALIYQDDLMAAMMTKMTRQLAGVTRGRPLALALSTTTTKRPPGVKTISNRRALFCLQSRPVVQLLLVIHHIIVQPFVAPKTFSVAEGSSASAPTSSMADPPTKLSYASAASGVSSVSNDTSGSASSRCLSDETRPNPDKRREQQRSSSPDDFQRSAAYFEAFTKYQELKSFIASHFQHSSRCRWLLVTAPAAALRTFAGLIQLSYRRREINACFTYLNILICILFRTLLV
jgi:hypothetical protein